MDLTNWRILENTEGATFFITAGNVKSKVPPDNSCRIVSMEDVYDDWIAATKSRHRVELLGY